MGLLNEITGGYRPLRLPHSTPMIVRRKFLLKKNIYNLIMLIMGSEIVLYTYICTGTFNIFHTNNYQNSDIEKN